MQKAPLFPKVQYVLNLYATVNRVVKIAFRQTPQNSFLENLWKITFEITGEIYNRCFLCCNDNKRIISTIEHLLLLFF